MAADKPRPLLQNSLRRTQESILKLIKISELIRHSLGSGSTWNEGPYLSLIEK